MIMRFDSLKQDLTGETCSLVFRRVNGWCDTLQWRQSVSQCTYLVDRRGGRRPTVVRGLNKNKNKTRRCSAAQSIDIGELCFVVIIVRIYQQENFIYTSPLLDGSLCLNLHGGVYPEALAVLGARPQLYGIERAYNSLVIGARWQ